MDENAAWLAFKDQLQSHYESLEFYHKELGGEYEDSSTSLMSVLQAALEASLEATKSECDRVRSDCQSMLVDMARIRTAMGETTKTCSDDPFLTVDPAQRIKSPLLDSQKVLRIEYTAAKRAFDERAAKVVALYGRLHKFSECLPKGIVGVEIPLINEQHPPEDVSLSKLGQLDSACARCNQEISRRKKLVQTYGRDIIQLWAELAIETSCLDSDLDRAIMLDSQQRPECLGLRDENMQALENKQKELTKQKMERQAVIQNHLASIRSLHKKLQLPDQETSIFLARVRGVSQTAISICEEEVKRLLELKKEHIEEFVKDARGTLNELWDTLYYNEDARLEFTPAFTDIFTDASLLAHENEIESLRRRTHELEPLLTVLKKHMELVVEKRELEAQTSDPSRFSRRGYNPMAESKLRMKIENTMPRIEHALRDAFERYEEEYFEPFTVWGEPYLDQSTEERKPVSRLENQYVRTEEGLGRPKTSDMLRKHRPRTPGNASRPFTGSTPARLVQPLGRSVSTPTQSGASSDSRSSKSPIKRAFSSQQGSTSSKLSRSLLDRPGAHVARLQPSSTSMPRRPTTGRAISTEALFNTAGSSQVDGDMKSRNKAKPPQSLVQRISPPKMMGPVKQAAREISGSSTSSQVSTENWDAFQHSSGSDDEGDKETQYHVAGQVTRSIDAPGNSHYTFTGLPIARDAKESPLREVPEEVSFVDEWGEEGF